VAMVGGATRAVHLDRPQYHLLAPGPTFDGRDVFAPVAAHLCNGVPLEEVGTEIDPATLTPGMLPISRMEGEELVAEVLWVDRYGNCQLNVDPDDLESIEGFDEVVGLRWGEQRRTARRATSFAELGPGQIGLVVDSYGMLALASGRGSAAEDLGLAAGDEVRLAAAEGQTPTTTTRVSIGRRGEGR